MNNNPPDAPGYGTRNARATRQETALNWVFGLLVAATGVMFVMLGVRCWSARCEG